VYTAHFNVTGDALVPGRKKSDLTETLIIKARPAVREQRVMS
jgi:hypothetical protein